MDKLEHLIQPDTENRRVKPLRMLCKNIGVLMPVADQSEGVER